MLTPCLPLRPSLNLFDVDDIMATKIVSMIVVMIIAMIMMIIVTFMMIIVIVMRIIVIIMRIKLIILRCGWTQCLTWLRIFNCETSQ